MYLYYLVPRLAIVVYTAATQGTRGKAGEYQLKDRNRLQTGFPAFQQVKQALLEIMAFISAGFNPSFCLYKGVLQFLCKRRE